MTVIKTFSKTKSDVVKFEAHPASGWHYEAAVINDTARTLVVGTVLGKFLTGGTATATATAGNTGNGTFGSITVGATAKPGTYNLRVYKAGANAGEFVIRDSLGNVLALGTVGVAFSGAGLSFTLADGATDFVVGDSFSLVVTGTTKWKVTEATATDGTAVSAGIFVGDRTGRSYDLALPNNTDTRVLVLVRGPAKVDKTALTFGSSVDTVAELNKAYGELQAIGILVEDSN